MMSSIKSLLRQATGLHFQKFFRFPNGYRIGIVGNCLSLNAELHKISHRRVTHPSPEGARPRRSRRKEIVLGVDARVLGIVIYGDGYKTYLKLGKNHLLDWLLEEDGPVKYRAGRTQHPIFDRWSKDFKRVRMAGFEKNIAASPLTFEPEKFTKTALYEMNVYFGHALTDLLYDWESSFHADVRSAYEALVDGFYTDEDPSWMVCDLSDPSC